MADKTEDIVVRVKNSEAIRAMQEIYGEADKLQKKLDSIYSSMLNNNNTISNKDRTTVENMTGYTNDAISEIQKAMANAKATGNSGDYERLVNEFTPMLTNLNETLKVIKSDRNSYKIQQINNAKTTSSKAFKSDHIYMSGPNNTYGGIKDVGRQIENFKLALKDLKSDISKANNSARRASNNLDIGMRKGSISYNRFQELKSSNKNNEDRYGQFKKELSSTGGGLYSNFSKVYQTAIDQRDIAREKATNPKTANPYNSKRYAELDEFVKELDKLNKEFDNQAKVVQNYGSKITKMSQDLDKAQAKADNRSDDSFNIGYDPNSFRGMLYSRRYSIARGLTSNAIANITSNISSGSQQRLSNFDNVKGTAYSLGGWHSDNRVYNALNDYGYKYGYSASEMSDYLNDYTSTTGRTGSLKSLGSMAKSWARQSRLVGNDQTTQALQQSAGNANNMSPSQMRSLGKVITNEITNSGMVAKGSQQQEGLTQLYSSLANLGLTQRDEKNLAGFQGLLAKGGPQWQGTQGASNYLALSSAMFNYNDPTSRRLFAGNNPKYSGVEGSARLLEDMQNATKSPTLFKRQMNNYLSAYNGDIEQASASLSQSTGGSVSVSAIKKAYELSQKGELSQSKMDSLLNSSSKANKNDDTFNKSGTSTVMKNESALADSALKASQAVDIFRKGLAGINHSTGVMSPLLSTAGSLVGQIGSQVVASMIASRLTGVLGKSKLFGAVRGTKIGSILFGSGGGTKATEESVKASEDAVKAGEEAVKSGSRASHLSGYAESAVTGAKGILSGAGSKLRGLSGLSRGISPASVDLMDSGAKGLLKTGMRSFGVLDTLLIGYDAYSSYKGNSKNRGQRMGKALGGDIGATLGGGLGLAVGGVPGAVVGGLLGNAVGGFAGKYVGKGIDWFRAKSKSSKKTKKEADEETTTLKGYNKMLDKAQKVIQEAKAIQSGNGSSDNSSSSDTDDISGSGDEALKKIAKTVSKKTGVPANLVYAQLALESSHGTSKVSQTDNNFSGIKFANQKGATQGSISSEGDHYAHFKSIGDFANAYADLLNSGYNLKGVTNAQQFAHALKNGKYGAYYGSSEASYASNLDSIAKQYAFGGIRTHATGGFIGNTPTLFSNDLGMESGTEAFIPLNAGHQLSGISNLSSLAGYFGKKVVDIADTGKSTNTTINPSYNINLTINGGTDDADNLANVVANRVKDMLNQYDAQQASLAKQNYYNFENSGLYV